MKVTIIGPGDYSLMSKYGKLNEQEVEELIDSLAKFLAENNIEIIIAADRGIPYQVAKKYREYGGKKSMGSFQKLMKNIRKRKKRK